MSRQTKDGFTIGHILIEGVESHQGKNVIIEFQNEYLIARKESTNQKSLQNDKGINTFETRS